METNRLKQFRVVVETGNLRKAAALLGISHSGLSKSMRALELEVGIPLFLPNGRGIVVSDPGRDFFERTSSFLSELDRLLGHPETRDPATQVARIGSFDVFTSYFMGKLMKEYLSDCEVEVHELAPARLEEALLLHKIDIGITYEPIPRAGIEYVKVTSLEMKAYALRGAFPGADLLSVPFVVPVRPLEGAPSGVKGRDGWPDERFQRSVRYRVDLLTTGIALARQGLCAIFMPRFVAELHNESARPESRLESIEAPKGVGTVRRDVYVVKRESSAETRALKQIAKALRKIC
jgi:DNA-binding transcriptional LysR family regulator